MTSPRTINCIIIDDEQNGIELLQELLREYCPHVRVIGTANSIGNGKQLLREHRPDLVFLDIKMPNGTGFDLIRELKETPFHVIFTTAHDEYAVRAFRLNATDYLLKPILSDELMEAVDRVIGKVYVAGGFDSPANRRIEAFNRLALPTPEGMIFIPVDRIVRCEAEGAYTRAHLVSNENVLFSKNLGQLEKRLSDQGFVRVHHSHLVNLQHIDAYQRIGHGQLVMSDRSVVKVSRNKKSALADLIQ